MKGEPGNRFKICFVCLQIKPFSLFLYVLVFTKQDIRSVYYWLSLANSLLFWWSLHRQPENYCSSRGMIIIYTRNATRCNNRDDLLHLSYTLKISIFLGPIYNSVEHLWWSVYWENSKSLNTFTKKLHRRCSLEL